MSASSLSAADEAFGSSADEYTHVICRVCHTLAGGRYLIVGPKHFGLHSSRAASHPVTAAAGQRLKLSTMDACLFLSNWINLCPLNATETRCCKATSLPGARLVRIRYTPYLTTHPASKRYRSHLVSEQQRSTASMQWNLQKPCQVRRFHQLSQQGADL